MSSDVICPECGHEAGRHPFSNAPSHKFCEDCERQQDHEKRELLLCEGQCDYILRDALMESDMQATDYLDDRNLLRREIGKALKDLNTTKGPNGRFTRTVDSVIHERLLRAIEDTE